MINHKRQFCPTVVLPHDPRKFLLFHSESSWKGVCEKHMKNTVITTLSFNCFLKVEKWAHIMLSIFCDTTSLSTSNHCFLIIGSNRMVSYDNVIINAVSHDTVPKILGFLPPVVPELPLPSQNTNTAVLQEQMGNKNTVLGNQTGVYLYCFSEDSWEHLQWWCPTGGLFPKILTCFILRTDRSVIACRRPFFHISDVRAQTRRQPLRLLPFEVKRKVKNNILQFQIFSD